MKYRFNLNRFLEGAGERRESRPVEQPSEGAEVAEIEMEHYDFEDCGKECEEAVISEKPAFPEYLAWKPEALPGIEAVEPEVDITPLLETQQEKQIVEYDDGRKAVRFDHPEKLLDQLPYSQGNNEFNKDMTCAHANLGSWLKIMGSQNTEKDVVRYASTHVGRDGCPLCSSSGGTFPTDIPVIWEQFGIPADSDSSKNIERIAEAVESGHAVSVGVNAGILWGADNPEGHDIRPNIQDGSANHQIGIVSCERDMVSGAITHFYINDTGRKYKRDACRKISISDFIPAFCVNKARATISKQPVW